MQLPSMSIPQDKFPNQNNARITVSMLVPQKNFREQKTLYLKFKFQKLATGSIS